jgi:hypothetical protein
MRFHVGVMVICLVAVIICFKEDRLVYSVGIVMVVSAIRAFRAV